MLLIIVYITVITELNLSNNFAISGTLIDSFKTIESEHKIPNKNNDNKCEWKNAIFYDVLASTIYINKFYDYFSIIQMNSDKYLDTNIYLSSASSSHIHYLNELQNQLVYYKAYHKALRLLNLSVLGNEGLFNLDMKLKEYSNNPQEEVLSESQMKDIKNTILKAINSIRYSQSTEIESCIRKALDINIFSVENSKNNNDIPLYRPFQKNKEIKYDKSVYVERMEYVLDKLEKIKKYSGNPFNSLCIQMGIDFYSNDGYFDTEDIIFINYLQENDNKDEAEKKTNEFLDKKSCR